MFGRKRLCYTFRSMADATLKKLLQLLGPEQPAELRCAAVRVLALVGERDGGASRAIADLIVDSDPAVRLQALAAVGQLRVEAALPQLLDRINEGGPESEAAAQAAARLGAKGTKALRELMAHTSPGLRRRIAGALAASGTASAESAALQALLDSDPGVVDAAARSLLDKLPQMSREHRRSLAEHVVELMKVRKGQRLPLPSEAAFLRLLSALADARGEAAFWARLEPAHPPELRAAALQALGTLPPPTAGDKLKLLLTCAADADFRVAAPALMILRSATVTSRNFKEWLPLLEAADPAARLFAIEKMGEIDHRPVADALLAQLRHPDRGVREAALARLSKLESGRTALIEALLDAQTPDAAWSLTRAQLALAKEYSAAARQKILAHASRYLEANDRRADALLTLLREADPRSLRDSLEERALALRKKKNYSLALVYLRLLTRDPACGEAIRFEQAGCSLKLSPKDLAADSRATDPAVQQFAGLIHRHETDPIESLTKAKWLEPEDLFYLGFHFVEGKGPERDFGGRVLELVIRGAPKAKVAKDAKSKLKSAGFV